MLSLSYLKSHLRFFFILAVLPVSFFVSGTANAAAVSCPATDGGAGDDDASADGTITISSNATWTMSGGAADDYWDCTGSDILITSNSTLSLQGDTTAGTYAYIKTDSLQIDSGSSISADARGCLTNGTGNGSMHPNTSTNVCTTTSDY
ncbi:MAG: hypothetical protein P8J32_06370, partial [bacterium]|nr:hypothetical protein [bacterium]